MNWLKNRLKERTSLDGALLIGFGVLTLLASPFASMAAWAAIAYGLFTLWKAQ